MTWLPGWNSIESTGWWSSFYFWIGIICLVGLVASETLSHIYGGRNSVLHAAEVTSLKAQLAETSNTVSTDHSIKNRIRRLFALIDPQILRVIDEGQSRLVIRMQPGDITALEKLLAVQGSGELLVIKGHGRQWQNSTLINGTLGPQGSVPLQTEIIIDVFPSLKSDSLE